MDLKAGQVVLFQGDSITDCNRQREDKAANSALGLGYAHFCAAALLEKFPGLGLQCYNRGVSGNRITDLNARLREDFIALKPDLVSILIGVNDTWHGFKYNRGIDVPTYGRVYRNMLAELRAALPAVKLVLCEPFVLSCGEVKPEWLKEMAQRRAVVKELAVDFKAIFVPFQTCFDEAVKLAPPAYWAHDGVHPTPAGHALLARAWLKTVLTAPQ